MFAFATVKTSRLSPTVTDIAQALLPLMGVQVRQIDGQHNFFANDPVTLKNVLFSLGLTLDEQEELNSQSQPLIDRINQVIPWNQLDKFEECFRENWEEMCWDDEEYLVTNQDFTSYGQNDPQGVYERHEYFVKRVLKTSTVEQVVEALQTIDIDSMFDDTPVMESLFNLRGVQVTIKDYLLANNYLGPDIEDQFWMVINEQRRMKEASKCVENHLHCIKETISKHHEQSMRRGLSNKHK